MLAGGTFETSSGSPSQHYLHAVIRDHRVIRQTRFRQLSGVDLVNETSTKLTLKLLPGLGPESKDTLGTVVLPAKDPAVHLAKSRR